MDKLTGHGTENHKRRRKTVVLCVTVTKELREEIEAAVASGIAGGRYRPVVESLQLFHAAGSIFDHVLLGPDVAQRIEAMVSDVAD